MDIPQKKFGFHLFIYLNDPSCLKSSTDTREADSPSVKTHNSKLIPSMNTHCRQNCTLNNFIPPTFYISGLFANFIQKQVLFPNIEKILQCPDTQRNVSGTCSVLNLVLVSHFHFKLLFPFPLHLRI